MKLNTIQRKKFRVTGKLKKVASSDRLRLSISRSAKNISAQIIDDVKNITLVSCFFCWKRYSFYGQSK